MANATFNFVGSLRAIKDSETRKGFAVTNYDSGWMNEKLRFMVIAGDNRHFVEINAGRWSDEKKNVIYAFTKSEGDKKGESIRIPWDKRNNEEIIKTVAGWKVFTVDLDTYQHRKELEENGDDEALEASRKKTKHFLAGTDFCEYVNKLVNSEKAKDMKFRVKGNIVQSYSEKTGKYYTNYEVTKIYKVENDTADSSEVDVDFFFTENAFDDEDYDEIGKAVVSGYTQFYDSTTKKNWFAPMSLVVRDKKKLAMLKKNFNKFEDDEVRKIGLVCSKIDGAQRVDVTVNDLSEEARENIEAGLITEAQAIRDAGGQMYGDPIREMRIEKLGRGYSNGSETTTYEIDALTQTPTVKMPTETEDDNTDIDIFDDDEL